MRLICPARFRGPQSDVASWFSCQWHATKSRIQSITELNTLLQEIEDITQDCEPQSQYGYTELSASKMRSSYIDAVVVSHEFTDHCNRLTLLELGPATPIYATGAAAQLIRSWNHFNTVHEIPPFDCTKDNWRSTSLETLPNWLGISRMVKEGDALYYHSAILIAFDLHFEDGAQRQEPWHAEAVIYTPHGINAQDLRPLPSVQPPLRTLALLHGLHDIKLSMKQLNLGAHNGLQAQRICRAKYWISTHDEVKTARGFIAPFLCRKVLSLKEAIEWEKKQAGLVSDSSELADSRGLVFENLGNGESLLLA